MAARVAASVPVGIVVALTLTASACRSSADTEQVERAMPVLIEAVAEADLMLADTDARCIAEALPVDDVEQIGAGGDDAWPPDLVHRVASATVTCVGVETLARTTLAPITEGASEQSVACAVDRVDAGLLARLIAADMGADDEVAVEAESVVVEAVSFCLEPVELLDRGD